MPNILPVELFFGEILGFLSKNNILLIVGDTGSGKTTKLPIFLNFSGLQKSKVICCVQPRRIGAISISKMISKSMNVSLGSEVGFTIRFENYSSRRTKINFVTDGILLKEFTKNPLLEKYSILILDEIHERSSNIELILSLCKNLLKIRADLKLIMTSATINVEKFSKFFSNCPILCIPGKTFSIKLNYLKNFFAEFISNCYNSIIRIIKNSSDGDILVFLPGEKDIDTLGNLLFISIEKKNITENVDIIPVFGNLPFKIQTKITRKNNQHRRIILSTNISETSLTIPGILYIIDSGLIKKKLFNHFSFSHKLFTIPTSKSSAIQRAGRAGRTKNGTCLRNYTKWSYRFEMKEFFCPEIKRGDFARIILFLKGLGLENIFSFDWIDFPTKNSFLSGLKTLFSLGALNKNGNLTKSGRKILELPLDPQLGKSMISSHENGFLDDFIPIASLLLSNIPLENFCKIKNSFLKSSFVTGDHSFLLLIFNKWKLKKFSPDFLAEFGLNRKSALIFFNIENQLKESGKKIFFISKKKKSIKDDLIKSFLSGFFLNLALVEQKKIYKIILRKKFFFVFLHPESIINYLKKKPVVVFFCDCINMKYPLIKTTSYVKKSVLLEFVRTKIV